MNKHLFNTTNSQNNWRWKPSTSADHLYKYSNINIQTSTEKLQHQFPIAFLAGFLYDYFRTPDKNNIAKMICQAAIASK
jgi:hypothetical protein